MGARLFIRSVDGRRVEEELAYPFDQLRVVIGRSAAADVRLPHRTVSERHASLEQQAGAYRLTDNASTNGTRVNGTKLVPHRPRRLQDGDQLELGVYQLTFHDGILVTEPLTTERTTETARRLLREQTAASEVGEPDPPRLVVVTGPHSGASLAIPPFCEPLSVGSDPDCSLCLEDPAVAGKHLRVSWCRDGVDIQGLGSPPQTFRLGEKKLYQYLLRDGDEVQVGDTSLLFEEPVDALLSRLEDDADQAHEYGVFGARPLLPSLRQSRPAPAPSTPPPPTAPAATEETAPDDPPPATEPSHPPADLPQSSPSTAADLLVFGLAGVMLTISIAALVFLLRAH